MANPETNLALPPQPPLLEMQARVAQMLDPTTERAKALKNLERLQTLAMLEKISREGRILMELQQDPKLTVEILRQTIPNLPPLGAPRIRKCSSSSRRSRKSS